MDDLDQFRLLVAYLGDDSAYALEQWCQANDHTVRIPRPPWQSSDGYSGATLHTVAVGRGSEAYKLILKRIPPWTERGAASWPAGEPGRHRYFLDHDESDFARDHLVRQRFDAVMTSERHVLMFQDLAADGQTCMAMADVPSGRLADGCALVAGALIGQWNSRYLSSVPVGVCDFLRAEIGRTITAGGTVNRWARQATMLDSTQPWITFSPDRTVLPNPLLMALGCPPVTELPEIEVLRGRTHGDLHLLNVLVPRMPDGEPGLGAFQIIDLATATIAGSLTRDLVTLMLSAIGTGLAALSEDRQQDLIQHVLSMGGATGAEPPFAVTASMCATFRRTVAAARGGWSESWEPQFWLTVQALGLAFTAYERLQPAVRWWYFRLAAHAAARVMAHLAPQSPIPAIARTVENPFSPDASASLPRTPHGIDLETLLLSAYHEIDRLDAADPEATARLAALCDRCLRALGPHHVRTLTFQHNLAFRLERTDPRRALELYERVYARAHAVLGAFHKITVSCEEALGRRDLRRRADEAG